MRIDIRLSLFRCLVSRKYLQRKKCRDSLKIELQELIISFKLFTGLKANVRNASYQLRRTAGEESYGRIRYNLNRHQMLTKHHY